MRRTRPVRSRTQGAGSNHKNLPWFAVEPPGHGIGRSRSGLTTKIHQAVDGHGRPLAMIVTGGQRNDGAMLADVLGEIRVPRIGQGRPRTRPDAVIADRAYATGVIRTELRRRGIKAVIPDKKDQIAARRRRGSRGGRPYGLDTDAYRGRNVIERYFALAKQWRGIATRFDKLAITYRAGVTLCAILTWARLLGDTPWTLRGGAPLGTPPLRSCNQPTATGRAPIWRVAGAAQQLPALSSKSPDPPHTPVSGRVSSLRPAAS